MKTICIKHPLRELVYTTKEMGICLPHEVQALDDYRKAHDEVWKMKLLFEKERGNVLLAIIQIGLLEKKQQDLQDMSDYYNKNSGTFQSAPLADMDYKLQVELRDFYLNVTELHQVILRFYDDIRNCTNSYNAIIDTFYRSEKPIDPLNFTVLNAIFHHHEDMDVDIVSLDKDLQGFLQTLTEIYSMLDDYIVQYNELYRIYSRAVSNIAQLSKEIQQWNGLWETKQTS